jgi:F-type H+-transporting ATPase subunit c
MVRRITMIAGAVVAALVASPLMAMAQEAAAGGSAGHTVTSGLIGLGAAIGLGIAAMGCGVGQGRAGAAALESIGRNPNSANNVFVPMIIVLAFIESLTLYALVISFLLQAKI